MRENENQMSGLKVMVVFFALILNAMSGISQSGQITVTHIANAGLSLSDGSATFYVDFPYKSGFFMYAKYSKSELSKIRDSSVLLFTHRHPDHYSMRRVGKLVRRHDCVRVSPTDDEELIQLSKRFKEFSIQAIQTGHHLSKKHYSYLITWHGKRIFVSGDTEQADTIAAIKDLDWVFGPAWLLLDAMEKKLTIDTKKFGIYHVGKNDKITVGNPKYQVMGKLGEEVVVPY